MGSKRKFRSTAFLAAVLAGVAGLPAIATPARAEEAPPAPLTAPRTNEPPAPGEEVLSLRNAYGSTFATDVPGQFRTELHPRPVNFRSNGQWQPIDPTLIAVGGELRQRANDVAVSLPANGAGVTRLAFDSSHFVSYGSPVGALPSVAAFVNDTSATLPGILPGSDLRYESRWNGVKTDIVLRSPSAPTTFTFPLVTQGLTASLDDGGNVRFADSAGVVRAVTPHGYMTDANVDPHSGDAARSDGVTYQLLTVAGIQALKVTLDANWVHASDRQWPIIVDPTLVTYSADTDDMFVQQPYTNDYSASVELKAGTFNGGTDKARSFLHFAGVNALDGKVINSAYFKPYEFHSYSCTRTNVSVYRITGAWAGTGTRTYPGPAVSDKIFTVSEARGYSSACPAARITFNVSGLVRNWASNTWANNGLAILADSETDSLGWKKFDSRNGTNDPQLEVTWSEPNRAPGQVFGRSIGGNVCACSPGLTADSSPSVTGSTTDPDGDTIKYFYEIYPGYLTTVDASGNATVSGVTASASGSTAFLTSGAASSYTPPTLSDGQYSYRVRAYDGALYGVWSSGWAQFTVDAVAPSTSVSSTTHPDPNTWYSNNNPSVGWGASSEAGVQAFSYILDQTSTTAADTIAEPAGNTKTYSGLADGLWYFHVRAQSGTNLWGPTATYGFKIDTTAPTAPVAATSSTHSAGAPSANRNVTVAWPAGTDGTSGVNGYSVDFNGSAATPADTSVDVPSSTTNYTSTALNDGVWYFHVRTVDNAGNVSADTTYGPIVIDATGPTAPAITSTDHDQTSWSTNTSAHFAWTQTDASVVTGYSVLFDQTANSDPGTTVTTATPASTRSNVADGVWYLHVRAVDAAGNWGATGTFVIHVDATAPVAPPVTSTTHPSETSGYTNASPSVAWSDSDVSGITGYSWILDTAATTTPDDTSEGTSTATNYSNLASNVDYYFHVKAQNGSGQWGPATTFAIHIYELADGTAQYTNETVAGSLPTGALPDSALPPTGPAADTLSGLFPQVQKLGQPVDPGALLGSAPIFNGPIFTNANAAAQLQQTTKRLLPPNVPAINLGTNTLAALASLRPASNVVPNIHLVQVVAYTADTTVYTGNGSSTTRTDVFPACTPTLYNATNGQVGLPTTYNLRINFCPDASTLNAAEQRLTYTLDALTGGIRAKVAVTYVLGATQVKLVTTSQSADLPVDQGTGAPINAGHFCSNPSTTVAPAIPGAPVTPDTLDGFCAELRVGASGRVQTAHITSAAGSAVSQFVVEQDAVSSGGAVSPTQRLTIDGIPASASHAYTLTGRTATTDVRETGLHVTLVDPTARQAAIPEALTAESFASDGSVAIRAQLRDEAQQLDTDLSATVADAGDPATAPIQAVRLSGSQVARPSQALSVQSYSGGALAAMLSNTSFATAYDQYLKVVMNQQGQETGVQSSQRFTSGAPAGGQFQLARFKANGNPDAVLDLQGFAATSDFSATVVGDPAAPTGAEITKNDSAQVADQLIQLLQYPDSGNPRRVVLSSSPAADARASAAVPGQNVYWHRTPPTMDLTTTETPQSGSSTPGTVVVSNTATNPDPQNILEISDLQGGVNTSLVLKSLTSDHTTRIDVSGDINNLQGVIIRRTNNSACAAQALQLLQTDQSGLLANVRFLGTAVDEAGLNLGNAGRLRGRATGLPTDWSFGASITKDNQNRPNDAIIAGTGSTFATGAALTLTDVTQGLTLRLGDLPEQYRYDLGTVLNNNGLPSQLTLTGSQNRDNFGGLIELSYSGSRLLAGSLARAFNYKITVEGDPANPDGATIQQAQTIDAGNGNPGELLQINADTPARFAVTVAGSGATPSLPTTGSRGTVVWNSAPANFALRLARDIGSNKGAAVISANQDPAASADLRISLTCASGQNDCTAGTSQSLRKHGGSSSWSLGASYTGNVTSPTALALSTSDTARQATDIVELSSADASGTTQRFSFTGASGNTTGVSGTTADGTWRDAPANARLDFSRTTDSNNMTMLVLVGSSNVDNSGADLILRQLEHGATRTATMHGLAKTWSIAATAEGSANPKQLVLRTTSTTRNSSDWFQVTNSYSGAVQQRLQFLGSSPAGAPSGPAGATADAVYQNYPADSQLGYARAVDSNGKDTAFDATLVNKDAAGALTAVPSGVLTVNLFSPPSTEATERVVLTNIPAQITKLHYDLPTASNPNCIGGIGYNASDSNAKIQLRVNRAGGCFNGVLKAAITGMPSLGLAAATLDTNGTGRFYTYQNPDGSPQEVQNLEMQIPVPQGLASRFTNPADLPQKQFCPEVGEVLGARPLCLNASVSVHNLAYSNLRLNISADLVSALRVKTNVAQSDYNQYGGSASSRDQDLRKALWKSLPLVGIANGSRGEVRASVTGVDVPGDGSSISEHVDCCLYGFLKNVHFDNTYTVPDGQPLGVRFWSWNLCQDQNGTTVKCNRSGQSLNYTKGSFIHTHIPGNRDSLPFSPSFDAGYYNSNNPIDPKNNSFYVRPGDTTYFVPNPYGVLMSQDAGEQGKWSVEAQGGIYQTDWFWPMLLHVNAPDPLGFTQGG